MKHFEASSMIFTLRRFILSCGFKDISMRNLGALKILFEIQVEEIHYEPCRCKTEDRESENLNMHIMD